MRYLAVVDITRVPLYLAAGPSLEASTTSTETEDWFSSILLDGTALRDIEGNTQDGSKGWWCTAQAQSPVGVLAQVSASERISQDGARVTEILFYSTAIERPNNAVELQLHALPLSSNLLYKAPSINTPPLSPVQVGDLIPLGTNGRADGQFLTPYVDFRKPDPVLSSKRKSVADIFDAATEWRTKARWKGEERVSAPIPEVDSASATAAHRRSASLGSKADVASEHTRAEAGGNVRYVDGNSDERLRPAPASELCEGPLPPQSPIHSPSRLHGYPSDLRSFSRRGTVDGLAKRSSLSRVTSMIDADEGTTLESRNKDAISRLVMAGMRLYGLQQRKKSTKLQRHPITPEILANEKESEDAARDEEYKLVYHQTYKGAVFAFVSPPQLLPTPLSLVQPRQ